MFPKLLLLTTIGLSSIALNAPSAISRIETGTGDLLRTMAHLGVRVYPNSNGCPKGTAGMFKYIPRPELHICYEGNSLTANEFDTVRHEAWHYLQYCVGPKKPQPLSTFHSDKDSYVQFIRNGLSDTTVKRISSSYRDNVLAPELEAFAAAQQLTAGQISSLIRKHCIKV